MNMLVPENELSEASCADLTPIFNHNISMISTEVDQDGQAYIFSLLKLIGERRIRNEPGKFKLFEALEKLGKQKKRTLFRFELFNRILIKLPCIADSSYFDCSLGLKEAVLIGVAANLEQNSVHVITDNLLKKIIDDSSKSEQHEKAIERIVIKAIEQRQKQENSVIEALKEFANRGVKHQVIIKDLLEFLKLKLPSQTNVKNLRQADIKDKFGK